MADIIASNDIALFITDAVEILIPRAITGQFRFAGRFAVRYFMLFIIRPVVIVLMIISVINLYRRLFPPLRLLEIHGDHGNEIALKMDGLIYKYRITETLHYSDINLFDNIFRCEALLINDTPSKVKNRMLK